MNHKLPIFTTAMKWSNWQMWTPAMSHITFLGHIWRTLVLITVLAQQ